MCRINHVAVFIVGAAAANDATPNCDGQTIANYTLVLFFCCCCCWCSSGPLRRRFESRARCGRCGRDIHCHARTHVGAHARWKSAGCPRGAANWPRSPPPSRASRAIVRLALVANSSQTRRARARFSQPADTLHRAHRPHQVAKSSKQAHTRACAMPSCMRRICIPHTRGAIGAVMKTVWCVVPYTHTHVHTHAQRD